MGIFDDNNENVRTGSANKSKVIPGTFTGGGNGGRNEISAGGRNSSGGRNSARRGQRRNGRGGSADRNGSSSERRFGNGGSRGSFLQNLPDLWWVDLIGIMLTISGLVAIGCNFDTVCMAILTVIYNLMSFVGIILLIVGIVLVVWMMVRRRRYRYYY